MCQMDKIAARGSFSDEVSVGNSLVWQYLTAALDCLFCISNNQLQIFHNTEVVITLKITV